MIPAKIIDTIKTLSSKLEGNEALSTAYLNEKLTKLACLYPNDSTILGLASVFSKLSNNRYTITRNEFQKLYNKHYTNSTKFANFFEKELGIVKKAEKKTTQQISNFISEQVYNYSDPVLANALSNVFEKKGALQKYSKAIAVQAEKQVVSVLDNCGMKPSKVSIASGNETILIVRAEYDTPKGMANILIPVETTARNVFIPTKFVTKAGIKDLNNKEIKEYIIASTTSTISEPKPTQEIVIKKLDEATSFEEKFKDNYASACFLFGAEKIKTATDLIVRELKSFGHNHLQLSVNSINKDKVSFTTSLEGNVAVNIPVKIGTNVEKPTVLICNGKIYPFTSKSINSIYHNNEKDYTLLASASPLFNLKSSDLLSNIRNAIEENNIAKAEDALNVLSKNGDVKAYAIGFELVKESLAGNVKKASSKCCHATKKQNSVHLICTQTGLPLNKIYQDEYGNCRPLYRKGQEESSEPAYLMNSKILF